MLRHTFIELTKKFTADIILIEILWNEIEKHYSNKNRFYHNFLHLDNLYNQLVTVRDQIEDWEAILFSLFYHDVICDPAMRDNEEQSAAFARDRLQRISFPAIRISKCVTQILATKGHSKSNDHDINLFTDADLSILGQDWSSYSVYFKQVRKEYSIYPDSIYKPGRKKVLNHFLQMESIFKTEYFSNKYENEARKNLARELDQL